MVQPRKRKDKAPLTHGNEEVITSDQTHTRKLRRANLFDAVAGRVYLNGFIQDGNYGRNEAILAPEEVLFKSRKAPERTQEDDFHWANRDLNPGSLPSSDLLKVIHSFAADYYQGTTVDAGQSDTKSMDDSALIALGILLEESAANTLGTEGDMVFTEGQPFESTESENPDPKPESKRSRITSIGSFQSGRSSKRQRI